jgi:L,D-peptidoglycan transpeptidase YkuD (ErfK/YbiS/YcfS/YnhG family)
VISHRRIARYRIRMTRRLWCRAAVLLLLAACGTNASKLTTSAVPTITSPTTTAPTSTSSTSMPTSTTRTIVKSAGPKINVKGSQAIIVTTPKYGATDATVTAYTRTPTGWRVAYGPWSGYVGAKGIAPAGEKREGDGRTPTGTFGFDFMFGVKADPGVKYEFRPITGPNIVWVENPDSRFYNQWVDANEHPEEADQDNMYKPGVYDYGAVIAYNTKARTPGLGSGIFLHVSHDRPTAGCVSLTEDKVVTLLKWLDPTAAPSIVIGVAS